MRKSLNAILLVLIIALTGTVSTFAADAAAAPQSAPAAATGVVNINTADAAQLALLPRIGAKAATQIIEYRKANGPFKKTTDLMQVKGIGAKSFETLSQYLVVEGKTTLSSKVSTGRKNKSKASK
jgi:competence ComEA-like helix-hairpin-helix protein